MRAFHDGQDFGSGIGVCGDGGGAGYRADCYGSGGCKCNGSSNGDNDYNYEGGCADQGVCLRCDFDPAEQDTVAGWDGDACIRADGGRLSHGEPVAADSLADGLCPAGWRHGILQSTDQIKGLPDWFMGERYDVDTRIADEDRAEWQKPESQKAMLQAMLQAMFAERCKLTVHREVKEVGVSSLVVAKGGPKFKETDPTVEHPNGIKLPWGGTMVMDVPKGSATMSFYGATMASFASMMATSGNGGRPIQDKTGLAGKYDITLKLGEMMMGSSRANSRMARLRTIPGFRSHRCFRASLG